RRLDDVALEELADPTEHVVDPVDHPVRALHLRLLLPAAHREGVSGRAEREARAEDLYDAGALLIAEVAEEEILAVALIDRAGQVRAVLDDVLGAGREVRQVGTKPGEELLRQVLLAVVPLRDEVFEEEVYLARARGLRLATEDGEDVLTAERCAGAVRVV